MTTDNLAASLAAFDAVLVAKGREIENLSRRVEALRIEIEVQTQVVAELCEQRDALRIALASPAEPKGATP